MSAFRRVAGLFALLLTGAGPAWADCDNPADNQEQVRCASAELRTSDREINDLYGRLRAVLPGDEQATLKAEQRAWLRLRDEACVLDRRISDRELWFQALEADPRKMTCVIRFTTERNKRLATWLKLVNDAAGGAAAAPAGTPASPPQKPPAPPPASAAATGVGIDDGIYEIFSHVTHTTGKWYFEVSVESSAIARQVEMAITLGVVQDGKENSGWLVRLPRSLAVEELPPLVLGVAVDLDSGFLYGRSNSGWPVQPGAVGGVAIKPRLATLSVLGGTVDLTPLLKAGLIKPNFGERTFQYELPPGYRAYDDKVNAPQSPP